MLEDPAVQAAGIAVLSKALDFLFDEARKILAERRSRREKEEQTENSTTSKSATLTNASQISISEAVKTKQQALNFPIDSQLWNNSASEVEALLSLIKIQKKNYYLARQQYAKWTSELAPPIIIHRLDDSEEALANTINSLQTVLRLLYEESSQINFAYDSSDDEPGYLDFAVDGMNAMEEITRLINQITASTNRLNEEIVGHTGRLNSISGPTKTADTYKITSSMSRIMIDYSLVVENYFPEIDDNIIQLRSNVSSLIIWIDTTSDNLDELQSYRETITKLFDSIDLANNGIEKFRNAFQDLRNLGISRAMNRASSRLVRVTDSLLDRFHDLQEFCLDTIELIEDQLS